MYNVDDVISLGDLNLIYYILKNLVKGIDTFNLSDRVTPCESGTYNVTGNFNQIDNKLQPTTDIDISIDNPFKWCTYIITFNVYEQGHTDSLEHKRELKYNIIQKDDDSINCTINLYDLNPNELIDPNATVEIIFNVNEQTEAITISLSADKTTVYYGQDLILSGTLVQGITPLSNATVQIFQNNLSIGTVTTDNNGHFTKTVSNLDTGEYNFKAGYKNIESQNVEVLVREVYEIDTDDTIFTYYDGEDFIATVTDYQGNPYGVGENVAFILNGTTYNKVIDSNGEAKLPITLETGTYSIKSTYRNLSNDNTITVQKASSTVNITASSSTIIYGEDNLTISGSVTGAGGITGTTVKLYDGNTLIETLSLSNGSYYTYFSPTGLAIGTHSFKVVYDGDSNHNQGISSIINVEVVEIVKTISLSVSPTTVESGNNILLSCDVTSTDGEIAREKFIITIRKDGSEIDEIRGTTDQNGHWSQSQGTSNLPVGDYTFQAKLVSYDAESAIIPVSVIEPQNLELDVTSTKSILSYADGESATVTATLTNNGVGVQGKTLSYTVKHGATTIDSGTGTTNSNGQVSITYASAGIGDIDIEFDYDSLLQETYAIQDLYYYDTQTIDKNKYSITQGSATLTYNNNGLTVQGTSSSGDTYVENTALQLPTNYSLECQITGFSGTGGNYGGLCFDNLLLDFRSVNTTMYTLSPLSSLGNISAISTNDILRIEKNNGVINIYINDVLKSTQTISTTGVYKHRTYNSRALSVKNLKVKAL